MRKIWEQRERENSVRIKSVEKKSILSTREKNKVSKKLCTLSQKMEYMVSIKSKKNLEPVFVHSFFWENKKPYMRTK